VREYLKRRNIPRTLGLEEADPRTSETPNEKKGSEMLPFFVFLDSENTRKYLNNQKILVFVLFVVFDFFRN